MSGCLDLPQHKCICVCDGILKSVCPVQMLLKAKAVCYSVAEGAWLVSHFFINLVVNVAIVAVVYQDAIVS